MHCIMLGYDLSLSVYKHEHNYVLHWQEVCNGKGECTCGECECTDGCYEGKTCDLLKPVGYVMKLGLDSVAA